MSLAIVTWPEMWEPTPPQQWYVEREQAAQQEGGSARDLWTALQPHLGPEFKVAYHDLSELKCTAPEVETMLASFREVTTTTRHVWEPDWQADRLVPTCRAFYSALGRSPQDPDAWRKRGRPSDLHDPASDPAPYQTASQLWADLSMFSAAVLLYLPAIKRTVVWANGCIPYARLHALPSEICVQIAAIERPIVDAIISQFHLKHHHTAGDARAEWERFRGDLQAGSIIRSLTSSAEWRAWSAAELESQFGRVVEQVVGLAHSGSSSGNSSSAGGNLPIPHALSAIRRETWVREAHEAVSVQLLRTRWRETLTPASAAAVATAAATAGVSATEQMNRLLATWDDALPLVPPPLTPIDWLSLPPTLAAPLE